MASNYLLIEVRKFRHAFFDRRAAVGSQSGEVVEIANHLQGAGMPVKVIYHTGDLNYSRVSR